MGERTERAELLWPTLLVLLTALLVLVEIADRLAHIEGRIEQLEVEVRRG